MSFTTYILNRVLQGIAIIFVILIINFLIVNLAPGNPIVFMGGEVALMNKEYVEALKERWGLDKPLHIRLAIYLANVLRGDLGYSYRYLEPVSQLILERLGVTLLLTITSTLIAFAIGTGSAILAVRRLGGKLDTFLTTVSMVFWSIPMFWLGIILMLIFSVRLHLLPASGMISVKHLEKGIGYYLDILRHAILPITTLTLGLFPAYFKLARDTMITQLSEDYVTTFKAVGLPDGRIVYRHVFRNAILPSITLLGLQLGYSFAGAALIEVVFGWPGIGRLLLDAVYTRDYPVILGIFFLVSSTVVAANIVIDLLYAVLDPRIRYVRART